MNDKFKERIKIKLSIIDRNNTKMVTFTGFEPVNVCVKGI